MSLIWEQTSDCRWMERIITIIQKLIVAPFVLWYIHVRPWLKNNNDIIDIIKNYIFIKDSNLNVLHELFSLYVTNKWLDVDNKFMRDYIFTLCCASKCMLKLNGGRWKGMFINFIGKSFHNIRYLVTIKGFFLPGCNDIEQCQCK